MMTLPVLQEMLDLHEAGIVGNFMKGYNHAKSRHGRIQSNLKQDAAEIKRQEDEAKAAEKETAANTKKVNMQSVADDVNEFLNQYITRFPNYDSTFSAAEISKRYPSKEFRSVAAKAYTDLATRIEQLRVGFNRSLAAAGRVSAQKIAKFDQQAKQAMGANAGTPPAPLIRFVRTESAFFKRMIKVTGNSKLNDSDFKELLQLKMNQTNSTRQGDAAQALNILFGHMVSDFREYAKTLEMDIDADDEAERKDRMSNRT